MFCTIRVLHRIKTLFLIFSLVLIEKSVEICLRKSPIICCATDLKKSTLVCPRYRSTKNTLERVDYETLNY